MSGQGRSFLLILLSAGCVACSVPAAADQAFEAVQLECSPKAHFFSASRRWIWDIAPNFDERSSMFAIVSPESLENQRFRCNWEGHAIVVSAVRGDTSAPNHACALYADEGLHDELVEVKLDGNHLACLNGSIGPDTDRREALVVNADSISAGSASILTEKCSVNMQGGLRMKGGLHCEAEVVKAPIKKVGHMDAARQRSKL